MKRINKLKLTKYPDGGVKPAQPPVSDKAAAATETRSFNNITPMVDPTTGAVNWNLWNSALTAFPQGYNTAGDPTKKNPNEVNTVNYYVGQTIVPAIKTRQEVLNAAYAKKYGKTYDPKNPSSFQPTEDQYLDPETANKALQEAKLGTYDDYLQYTNAYNSYRSKTQIANTSTQGTQETPTGPQNYGVRHYNLFTPGYTPTPQPTNTNQPAPAALPKKALGGRFGDVMKDIGDMSWQDAGQLANNYGKATADTMLSTIGLSNVVPDDAYKGAGADVFKKTSGVMGKVGQAALPIALQAAGVPMGVTKTAQKGLSMLNPQEQQFPDGGLKKGSNNIANKIGPDNMIFDKDKGKWVLYNSTKTKIKQQNTGNPVNSKDYKEDPTWHMNGGVSQNPNAELEKEEVFQTPDGQVQQVNGPSHEQGGVPVNIPEGTRIWSDRLKVKGKTFAKLAAKYKTDKEEKIISDVKSSLRSKQSAELNMKTKTKKLDELFMTQEGMKAKKINSYIKRYGGVQQYPNGGYTQFTEPDELNPEVPGFINSNAGNVFGFGNQDNPFSLEPNAPEINPNNGLSYETPIEPNTYYNSKTGNMETLNMSSKGDTPYSNPEADLTPMDKISDLYKNNKEDINKGLGEAATFGMNNLANLAYLKNEGKRYDKVNYGKVNPNLMSDEESIRQIKEGYNTGLYNLKNSGNLSQSGRVAMASERMKQGAAAKERIANTNTGIKNQFEQFNKDLEIRGMQDEAANKGQAKTNFYSALGATGQNAALQTRDYKQRAMDQKKLSLVNSIFPNYKFDPKTFEYMFTLAQKQQGI